MYRCPGITREISSDRYIDMDVWKPAIRDRDRDRVAIRVTVRVRVRG